MPTVPPGSGSVSPPPTLCVRRGLPSAAGCRRAGPATAPHRLDWPVTKGYPATCDGSMKPRVVSRGGVAALHPVTLPGATVHENPHSVHTAGGSVRVALHFGHAESFHLKTCNMGCGVMPWCLMRFNGSKQDGTWRVGTGR